MSVGVHLRTVLLLLAAVAVGAAAAVGGRGAPAAAQTPEPPATLRIHVVHDLDKDGVRDAGEPGLAGWTVTGGSGDVIVFQGTTDANGEYVSAQGASYVSVYRQFGWLPTSPLSVEPVSTPAEIFFLVYNVGPTVMEVSGELIVAGLPATTANVQLASPYSGCLEYFISASPSYSYATLLISGDDLRSGCPAASAEVTILVEGDQAATLAFASGTSQEQILVGKGDSMRFANYRIDAARIKGTDCGVIIPFQGGLIPEGSVRVFVLSAKARPGCGAPGQQVTLFREGCALSPTLVWRAGVISGEEIPAFVCTPATPTPPPVATATRTPLGTVVLPDTGIGGLIETHDRRPDASAIARAAIIAAAAPLFVGLAWVVGRRRR